MTKEQSSESEPTSNKVKIYPKGRITKAQPYFPMIMERIKSNKDGFVEDNRATIERFLMDARAGRTIIGREKKKIGDDRLMKYLQDLKKLDTFFKKPFKDITSDDMVGFTLALEEGMLTSNKGKPFANETQVAIKKIIRKFYTWLEGGNEIVPEKVKYFDTYVEQKLVKVISREQMELMSRKVNCRDFKRMLMSRAIIELLFDIGSRAFELLEHRMENVKVKDSKVWIGTPISKTNVRWDILTISTQSVLDWLNVHEAVDNPDAQLFYGMSYDAVRMMIKRAGKRIGEHVTAQLLRKSGATYWLGKVSEARVKRRFGWSPNSRVLSKYSGLASMNDDELFEIEKGDKFTRQQETIELMRLEMDKMRNELQIIRGSDMDEAKRIIDFNRALEVNKNEQTQTVNN